MTDHAPELTEAEKIELRRLTRGGVLLFNELEPEVRELLAELRPAEVEAIRSFARLGPDGVQKVLAAVDFWQSISTVSKFVKWAIILFAGAVVGVSALMKAMEHLGGYFSTGRVP